MDQRSARWFMREIHYNKKMPDKTPTNLEQRFGDRSDQASRVQLIVKNIFSGWLIFSGAHCLRVFFLLRVGKEVILDCSSPKLHSKLLYFCYSNLSVLQTKYFLKRRLKCTRYPIVSHDSNWDDHTAPLRNILWLKLSRNDIGKPND